MVTTGKLLLLMIFFLVENDNLAEVTTTLSPTDTPSSSSESDICAKAKERVAGLEERIEDFRLMITRHILQDDSDGVSMPSLDFSEGDKELARREIVDKVTTTAIPGQSGGAVYTRWGKSSCPNGTELVYGGWGGGSWYDHVGAATDPVCLTKDPIYANFSSGVQSTAFVYGMEYEGPRLSGFVQDADVPCSVCRSTTRSSVVMIPGRTECYPGWNLEYFGYLMTGHHGQTGGSQYLCVDHQPEAVVDGRENTNGYLLYFVESICGSLDCPPYINGYEVTCAVCTM